MIVQVAVVSLVGVIIGLLLIKDPGDLRKKLQKRAEEAAAGVAETATD